MTLTDIFELQKEIAKFTASADIIKIFDENGEDCDTETAEIIMNSTPKFTISEQCNAFIKSELILCPDCQNSFPDKILSNAVDIISLSDNIPFGCCECGTMFRFIPQTNQFQYSTCN